MGVNRIPASLLDWRPDRPRGESRCLVSNVEPKLFPVDYFGSRLVRDILWTYTLTQLQAHATNYIYDGSTWLGFQMEKVLKEVEMGLDP